LTAGSGVELEDIEFFNMSYDKSELPTPMEGFRFIYVDELLNNEDFKQKIL
jgi:hypothetical protein